MVEQVRYGMGHHYDSLSATDKICSLKWFWGSVWLYYLGLWSTKISILFQYLRIPGQDCNSVSTRPLSGTKLFDRCMLLKNPFSCSAVEMFSSIRVSDCDCDLRMRTQWKTGFPPHFATDFSLVHYSKAMAVMIVQGLLPKL